MEIIIALAVVGLLVLFFVAQYNRLIRLNISVDESFAQVAARLCSNQMELGISLAQSALLLQGTQICTTTLFTSHLHVAKVADQVQRDSHYF